MLDSLLQMFSGMAWPMAIAVAWLVGEFVNRWLTLPRICGYGLAGFAVASSQGGFLANPAGGPMALLADFAIALILFELGQRINLRWLRNNPWLAVTSVTEALGTFVVVFFVARGFALETFPALLLAALAMSSSPVATLRVANDLKCSGQVTERMLHLSAFNCVLTVMVFKAVVGWWVLTNAGSILPALWSSLVVVVVSISIGALFGVGVPALQRWQRGSSRDATLVFAIATLLLTALTHTLQFSPLLAALSFGMVIRYRRIIFSETDRGFGTLGSLMTILLFVFISATLSWSQVTAGIWLALAVILTRLLVKLATTTALANVSGISWRKGALTGLALMPLSAFAILLLEQSRYLGIDAVNQIAGLGALILLLEVLGPIATQQALNWSGEAGRKEGG